MPDRKANKRIVALALFGFQRDGGTSRDSHWNQCHRGGRRGSADHHRRAGTHRGGRRHHGMAVSFWQRANERHRSGDSRTARRQTGRVRPHLRTHGARAEPAGARPVFGDVVRALQLQELARASQDAADHRPARRAGPGRECRRRRHRRWDVRGLQDRVPQPPVVHRTVSGRRDRRRRHHPRHLHDGRAPDWTSERLAVRLARDAAGAPDLRRRGCRGWRLRQQHRHPHHWRRDLFRQPVCGEPARQRPLPRTGEDRRNHQGRRAWRRQSGLLRRGENRPRRHPRCHDGFGRVRRKVGGETAGGAGRRSVHGEAPDGGLPRGDAHRGGRRNPGHGGGRADLLDERNELARRHRDGRRSHARAAA